jgi:hypothetical protein
MADLFPQCARRLDCPAGCPGLLGIKHAGWLGLTPPGCSPKARQPTNAKLAALRNAEIDISRALHVVRIRRRAIPATGCRFADRCRCVRGPGRAWLWT